MFEEEFLLFCVEPPCKEFMVTSYRSIVIQVLDTKLYKVIITTNKD